MIRLDEQTVSNFGLQVGITALILFMAFIVYDLARQSKAGRYGTLVMFGGLGMGAVGFVAKTILTKFMI